MKRKGWAIALDIGSDMVMGQVPDTVSMGQPYVQSDRFYLSTGRIGTGYGDKQTVICIKEANISDYTDDVSFDRAIEITDINRDHIDRTKCPFPIHSPRIGVRRQKRA